MLFLSLPIEEYEGKLLAIKDIMKDDEIILGLLNLSEDTTKIHLKEEDFWEYLDLLTNEKHELKGDFLFKSPLLLKKIN